MYLAIWISNLFLLDVLYLDVMDLDTQLASFCLTEGESCIVFVSQKVSRV